MEKYELVVIVDANAPQEKKESILKETTDAIGKSEAKVINSQVWLDKHRFTFRIAKCMEGTYYTVNFESVPAAINKIRQYLKLNEEILRSLIVRVE
jgi:ribosomal protein S6